MHVLADFLNHGTLPFIGRDVELRRIVEFWRGTFNATELRVMLLVGEAGIGKSRLLEQAIRQISDSGGSVVHVKIYPESTASFLSLVAHALWHPDAGRFMLAEEPEAKMESVGDAFRRLSRLRPTLFVLEDLHLLGSEANPEFGRLLKVLTDETISLLALARPVELEARSGLEPYLVEEFTLHGLMQEECARVWEEVSGRGIEPDAVAALHDATAGNPMALRSALRGALKSRDGARNGAGSISRTSESLVTLSRTLKRTVGLLADGMISHLTSEELEGAKRLASLGEVFSREAAAIMLADSGQLIEALLFKGIIATAVAPPDPLPGEPGKYPPIGFTHTLLHRQLAEELLFDADSLVRVIADYPLYSILPFRLLSERRWSLRLLDNRAVMRAFDRTIKIQIAIRGSAQWKKSEHTWMTAVRLLEGNLGAWSQADWERMLVKLIHHKLNMVRVESKEQHGRWLAYLASITADVSSDELATGRLHVLTNHDLSHSPGNPRITRELWSEAEKIIQDRPWLRYTFAYTDYVIAASINAYSNGDTEMRRRMEARANEILASPELPAPVRATFERKARPPFLSLYENAEELQLRLSHILESERRVEKNDLSVWMFCIDLLAEVAAVDMLQRNCDDIIPLMRKQGMAGVVADTIGKLHRTLAGAGGSALSGTLAFEESLAELPQWRREQVESRLALPFLDAALLRGESDEAQEIIRRYAISSEHLQPAQQVLIALLDTDPCSALQAARDAGFQEEEFVSLINLIIGDSNKNDSPAIDVFLQASVLRLNDILNLHAIIGLVEYSRQLGSPRSISANISDTISDALNRSLEWLGAPERELFAYMQAIFDRGKNYLKSKQATTWQKKIDDLANSYSRRQQIVYNGRLKLSMLGTITMQTPDGERQRFQGARARMLLAMMVINEMLKEPLSSAEFCRLAAGSDVVEIENARDVVKTTVHRIRELIGRDTILTDSGTPRLNLELMDVDLLEAHNLLKRAVDAVRRSSPMQAKGMLMSALEITRGEVPFPSLYDDFIEAVREDFENELRTTAIDVARLLVREGGVGDAVEVLRSASEAIPGDEELADLLHDALLQAGQRTEAERVKRKFE